MCDSIQLISIMTCLLVSIAVADPAEDDRWERKSEQSPIVLQDWGKLLSSVPEVGAGGIQLAEPPINNPLYGCIVDTDGNPVEGAKVMLTDAVESPEVCRRNLDQTDEEGRFVVYGAPGSDLLYVQIEDHILRQQTNRDEDVVIPLPRLINVRFQTEQWDDQLVGRVTIVAFPASSSELTPFDSITLSLQDLINDGLQFFPGRYLVQGRRQLEVSDTNVYGPVEVLEFEVNRDQPDQSVLLDSRTGQKIIGKVKGYETRLATSKFIGIKVQLLSSTGSPQPRTSSVRVVDTAVCDFKGVFAFHNVPAGDYRLQGKLVPIPKRGRNNQFRRQVDTKVFNERITMTDSRVMLVLPRDNPPMTTAHRVHDVLEMEHVTKSTFRDDSMPVRRFKEFQQIEDQDGGIDELLRLTRAKGTSYIWWPRLIELLGMLRPIDDRVVAAVLGALDQPSSRRWGGLITRTLLTMADHDDDLRMSLYRLRRHRDWRVRNTLVDGLGNRVSRQLVPDDNFVRLAVGLLDDPHRLIRKSAATWLGVQRISSSVERLTPLLNDQYGPNRALAAMALWNITGSADPSIATMIDVLQNGDDEARREALYHSALFAHFAEPALPALRSIVFESETADDALPNAQLRSRNVESAKRAIEAIEASIAWHNQIDRFEFQPQLLTDAEDTSPEPVWGKIRDGLQLGLTPIGDQKEFGIGDRIPIVLTLRNAAEAPVDIETGGRLTLDGPQVVDADENNHRTKRCLIRVGRDPIRFTLQPGQRLSIPMPGLGLGENPKPGEQLWHPFCATPPVGPVRLVQRFSFAVLDHANGIRKHTRLESGEIKVRLVSR